MKKMYLLLALLFIFANQAKGAKNVGARDGLPCDSFSLTNDVTVSDCADRRLSQDASERDGYTDQDINGKFYDKCCYMRAMLQGRYIYGCIGLERNETIDVIDYINLEEKRFSKYCCIFSSSRMRPLAESSFLRSSSVSPDCNNICIAKLLVSDNMVSTFL